eukprot:Clim_evm21s203 gene=Clim_evmTU21s203
MPTLRPCSPRSNRDVMTSLRISISPPSKRHCGDSKCASAENTVSPSAGPTSDAAVGHFADKGLGDESLVQSLSITSQMDSLVTKFSKSPSSEKNVDNIDACTAWWKFVHKRSSCQPLFEICEVSSDYLPHDFVPQIKALENTLTEFVEREQTELGDPFLGVKLPDLVTDRRRAVLLSWMAQVCTDERRSRETFHLSVKLLDVLLARHHQWKEWDLDVRIDNLQLTVSVLLHLAHKLLEPEDIPLETVNYYCMANHSNEELTVLEIKVSSILEWRFHYVTPLTFLGIYCKMFGIIFYDYEHPRLPETMQEVMWSAEFLPWTVFEAACTILDHALLHVHSNCYRPSELAAAAFWHSSRLDDGNFTAITGYFPSDLQCIEWIGHLYEVLLTNGIVSSRVSEVGKRASTDPYRCHRQPQKELTIGFNAIASTTITRVPPLSPQLLRGFNRLLNTHFGSASP